MKRAPVKGEPLMPWSKEEKRPRGPRPYRAPGGGMAAVAAGAADSGSACWAPSNVQHVIFEGLADAVITCCGAGGGRWKRV